MIFGPVLSIFSFHGCMISIFVVLFFMGMNKFSVSIQISLLGLIAGVFLLFYVTCSAICPKINEKASVFFYTKKPCLREFPGIYQVDGGTGLWWWYRLFPKSEDMPCYFYRENGASFLFKR